MNLIDEIEAAAHGSFIDRERYAAITALLWWPRIRAALEAAREMDTVLTVEGHDNWSQRKFREAMGE